MTASYFSGRESGEFLWNAKPRFGKTLTTYDLIKEMNFQELTETESFRQLFGETELTVQKISHPVKHILSHRIINAVFYKINISHENETIKDFEKLLLSELNQFPVSRLTELYLEKG